MYCPICGNYIQNGDPDEPLVCDCGRMFEVSLDIQDGRLTVEEVRPTDEFIPDSAQIMRRIIA